MIIMMMTTMMTTMMPTMMTSMMTCRTESRTFLCSETRLESIPCVEGVKGPGKLGNWMSPGQVVSVVVSVSF